MQRIVLDTNCLFQILPSISPYHKLWNDIIGGRVSLCVNTEILEEYEEKLAEKINKEIAHNVVEAIARLSTTVYQEAYIHFGLIEEDLDDNKFVDCAIAADAEYVVSNDKHFSVLAKVPWPKVIVLRLVKYFEIYQAM